MWLYTLHSATCLMSPLACLMRSPFIHSIVKRVNASLNTKHNEYSYIARAKSIGTLAVVIV